MGLDIARHKNILLKILKSVYADAEIGPVLGFKGGTAAYLFYDLPRFSIDLDFDLLDKKREGQVLKKMEKIIALYGKVKEAQKKRFNLFFLLAYEKNAVNIKIEINRRDFGSHYEVKTYLGIPMKVMVRGDMVAHKLVAMSERIERSNRDLYDAWFFLQKNWPINTKIIEERTGLLIKNFLQKNIKTLKEMPERNLLDGIGELLDEKQKAWTRENLKKDLLFLLKLKLEEEEKK
jgi:predicted nucleotidyltransferase component of viral defense system